MWISFECRLWTWFWNLRNRNLGSAVFSKSQRGENNESGDVNLLGVCKKNIGVFEATTLKYSHSLQRKAFQSKNNQENQTFLPKRGFFICQQHKILESWRRRNRRIHLLHFPGFRSISTQKNTIACRRTVWWAYPNLFVFFVVVNERRDRGCHGLGLHLFCCSH